MKKIYFLGAVAAMALTLNPALTRAAPAATAAKHYSTADTPISDLLADPAAKAVVDQYIPGLSTSDSIGMVSGMTLRALQPMAGDKISDKSLADVDAGLAKIPAK